ncbi:SRPBCC family protein [Methylobacterium sp. NEAU 140]|uniref:SRPBCC family protein n=1 Tax=Methylobacterium sp. NEAU 140 TaxID=3064945 RepID=UPI00273744AA|nr:SRPBCC family protein [Methylobacterium sp. NEAU 140]MDP4022655.1 SRPBCC family protein [Methylobacterium sp. NEAU 140]
MRESLVALALAALAAAPAGSAELVRSRDVAAPPAAVWALVGGFCAIALWHPQVERCTLSEEADDETAQVRVRTLDLRGGLGIVVEVETDRDERGMSYSYSFVQGALPVSAYNGTLAVRPNGTGATVIWSGTFAPRDMSEADALADMEGVYARGLDGIAREVAK